MCVQNRRSYVVCSLKAFISRGKCTIAGKCVGDFTKALQAICIAVPQTLFAFPKKVSEVEGGCLVFVPYPECSGAPDEQS